MLSYWLAQSTVDSFVSPDPVPTATVDQVLSPYIYVFYASFLVAYFFTPMMRQVALYYQVIDHPDANRKMHKEPVAYLGGIAVFLGWLAGLAMSQFVQAHRVDISVPHLHWPLAILMGSTLVVALGLWDDIRKVKPWVKITVQVIAALALLHGGIGTHCTGPLLAPIVNRLAIAYQLNMNLVNFIELSTSGLLTVTLVVGSCNAANLMDGLDGLCGGVSSIIAIGFVFLAVHMATIGHIGSTNTEGMRVVLGLSLMGAILGFAPFNFNPASIFLGDTGSMFIGFAFATMMTMMAEERSKWFLAAVVMYALPILDTALAFARRFVNKRPLFSADRFHIHHQLLARGFTVRQTVLISYGLACWFVILGSGIVFMRTRYVLAAYMVIFGSIIVAAYKGGLVHEKLKVASPRGIEDSKITNEGVFDTGGAVLEIPDNAPRTLSQNLD
jgi:UDP-GlcNAc:undecaprenyl-phosphate GlcNAc-1-phosphate transferase